MKVFSWLQFSKLIVFLHIVMWHMRLATHLLEVMWLKCEQLPTNFSFWDQSLDWEAESGVTWTWELLNYNGTAHLKLSWTTLSVAKMIYNTQFNQIVNTAYETLVEGSHFHQYNQYLCLQYYFNSRRIRNHKQ